MEVKDVLLERQKTHGKFKTHAYFVQRLKEVLTMGTHTSGTKLTYVQREAIEMILHKVSRITNGANDYEDHWVDLMGYAQLALNELRGIDV